MTALTAVPNHPVFFYRHLIQINSRSVPAWTMLHMNRISIAALNFARLGAVLAVLLFAPLTASATDSAAQSWSHPEHGTVSDYHANPVPSAAAHQGTPTNTPLHCHLMYHPAQATGLSQKPVENDLPLLALNPASVPAQETEARLPVASAQPCFAAPPRFILFGNFRS